MNGIGITMFKPFEDNGSELNLIASHGIKCLRFNAKNFVVDGEVNTPEILKLLNQCHERGLSIVICPKPTDVNQIRSFWVQMLSLGDHPAIKAYELCNEPENVEGWASCQRQLISLVKKHTWKPIIVSFGWGYRIDELFNDSNIWYSCHEYSPHNWTHQGVSKDPIIPDEYGVDLRGRSEILKKKIDWNTDTIKSHLAPIRDLQLTHGLNIFMGEFATTNDAQGGDMWVKDFMGVFIEYGWHWFYHTWRPTYQGYDKWEASTERMKILDDGWAS